MAKTRQSAGRNQSQSLWVFSVRRTRGLQLDIFNAHHYPNHRKRQLFSNQHLTQQVALWAFLCVTTSFGVVCHTAFSPTSESFLLLPPIPGSDGFSSIMFKLWVALPAFLVLGSDFCLCLVLKMRFTSLSSILFPWPGRFWLVYQSVMMVIMQLSIFLHTRPLSFSKHCLFNELLNVFLILSSLYFSVEQLLPAYSSDSCTFSKTLIWEDINCMKEWNTV